MRFWVYSLCFFYFCGVGFLLYINISRLTTKNIEVSNKTNIIHDIGVFIYFGLLLFVLLAKLLEGGAALIIVFILGVIFRYLLYSQLNE